VKKLQFISGIAAFLGAATAAHADTPSLNSGDTAWVLAATCLVIMMTVPGLALFYGGMVRKKNVLATLMQSFAACALITILWVVIGHTLAFDGEAPLIGGLSNFLLKGMTRDGLAAGTAIPETVFMVFQMSFAIITPAVICGAVADRMKFSALLWFMAAWIVLVYAPVAHWVWGGGFLQKMGFLDFAGGAVVELNSGIAGLVACVLIGKRLGFPTEPMMPHNLILSVTGAGLLWVGWLGFNGGSALAANGIAAFAMLNTQLAGAAGALVWLFIEWYKHGRPTTLGIISGAVAGLVAITPSCGYVSPAGALAVGILAGAICFYFATAIKKRFGYDDSLDVFGVHGIGGIVGLLGNGLFAAKAWSDKSGALEGNIQQLWVQVEGIVIVAVWCGLATFIMLKVIDATIGLRVTKDQEIEGLDYALHGEAVQ
jgi:ammonium transporter, Amt family